MPRRGVLAAGVILVGVVAALAGSVGRRGSSTEASHHAATAPEPVPKQVDPPPVLAEPPPAAPPVPAEPLKPPRAAPERKREVAADVQRTLDWVRSARRERRVWQTGLGMRKKPPLALIFTVDDRHPNSPDTPLHLKGAVAANVLYTRAAARWQPGHLRRRFAFKFFLADSVCKSAGGGECPAEAAHAPGKRCCWSPKRVAKAGPFANVWLKVTAMLRVVRTELVSPQDVGIYVDSDAFVDPLVAPVLPFEVAYNESMLPGFLSGQAAVGIVHDQSWWRALLNDSRMYRGRHTGGPAPRTLPDGTYPAGGPEPTTRRDTGVAVNSGVVWLSPRPAGLAESFLVEWLRRSSVVSPMEAALGTPMRYLWQWPWEQDRLNWLVTEEPPGLTYYTGSRRGAWRDFPGVHVPWGYGLFNHRNFKKDGYSSHYIKRVMEAADSSVKAALGPSWVGRPAKDVIGKLVEKVKPEPL